MELQRNRFKIIGIPILYIILWFTMIFFLFQLTDFLEYSDIRFRFLGELIPCASILFLGFIFNRYFEKNRLIQRFFFNGKDVLFGFLVGLIWFFLAFGLYYLLNNIEFTFIKFSHTFIWIFAIFLNTIMQEYLVRGFLYEYIKYYGNTFLAILLTTGFFLIMHGGAIEAGYIPILNIISMSLLMSLILEAKQNLIPVIIIHFVWNILGGLLFNSINLAEDYPSFIHLTVEGLLIFSGGEFVLEGSIITFFINLVLILYFFRKYFIKSNFKTI